MSPGNPSDPAIYGPINGVYVTLSQFQAWQVQEQAAIQAMDAQEFADAAASLGLTVQNPYGPVNTPVPVTIPGGTTTPPPVAHYVPGVGGTGGYCDLYPDDPLCDIWGGGGIPITGGGGGGTVVEQPIIINQGIAATDVNAAIDAGLSSLWAGVVGTLDAVLGGIVAGVQAAVTALGNAVKAAYAVLSRLAGFILISLEALYNEVIGGIIGLLQEVQTLLKDLYEDVLKPIAGALAGIRQRLLDLYKRFLRPILLWMQDIRRVLAILGLFHVNFASKLDAKLADLESRVTKPLFYLLGYTNAVANWINLISTVNYLIQQPTWLFSNQAYLGQTVGQTLNAMTPTINPSDLANIYQANAQPTVAQSVANGVTYIQSGGGPYAPLAAQESSYLASQLQQGPY